MSTGYNKSTILHTIYLYKFINIFFYHLYLFIIFIYLFKQAWECFISRPPIISPEAMYNRTKRTSDTVLEAHWMSRLRELERRDLLEQDSEGVEYGESDHTRTAGEVEVEEVEEVWEDVGDPEFLEFSVLKPASNTSCEMISCVSSAGSRDVACLDMRMVNMSAGAFSATARLVPLEKSKSVFAVVCFSLIKEHFNLKWMLWRLGVSEESRSIFMFLC